MNLFKAVSYIKKKLNNNLKLSNLYSNLTIVLLSLTIIFVIATYAAIYHASNPIGPDPRIVTILILVDLVLILSLLILISRRIFLIWINRKNKLGGSRLQSRILIMFCTVASIPTIIVAICAALFFNYGIQSWFNERVSTALDESVLVAEAYFKEHINSIKSDALIMTQEINNFVAHSVLTNSEEFSQYLTKQAYDRSLFKIYVFEVNPFRIIAQGKYSLPFIRDDKFEKALVNAKNNNIVIFDSTTNRNKVQALIKIDNLPNSFLFIARFVDSEVMEHMEKTQGAVSEYSKLKSQISNLQIQFLTSFVVVALLLLFAAIWLGIMFSVSISKPINYLVDATEKVKQGNLKIKIIEGPEHDEIAVLTRAFNRMIIQLDKQHTDLIEANIQIDTRRQFSETILSSVSAGIVALNNRQLITLINPSAVNILNIKQGQYLNDSFDDHFAPMKELLELARNTPGRVVQSEINFMRNHKSQILFVKIICYQFDNKIQGYVMTFDDITALVLAQRSAAWSDIARRIAHEIKNPLTPINLAAERIRKKYTQFIEDKKTFNKYIETIVKNVVNIGLMVEEFVNFSKMPSPVFEDINIAKLLKDIIFTRECLENDIKYELHGENLNLVIEGDERQLGQVFTNIFKNSEESILQKNVQGLILVSIQKHNNEVVVTFEDNGLGFPVELFERLTEPYLTNKPTGTGLGLAIVKKIIDDHSAHIEFANKQEGGAIIKLFFQIKA